jgi:hypothetical protein
MGKMKSNKVLVRGMKKEWFHEHFTEMVVYVGNEGRHKPSVDVDFIGFYLEAPDSAITHIGVVEDIGEGDETTSFWLKAIIKLDNPIKVDHPIRKQEYWTLEQLGISKVAVLFNQFSMVGGNN